MQKKQQNVNSKIDKELMSNSNFEENSSYDPETGAVGSDKSQIGKIRQAIKDIRYHLFSNRNRLICIF